MPLKCGGVKTKISDTCPSQWAKIEDVCRDLGRLEPAATVCLRHLEVFSSERNVKRFIRQCAWSKHKKGNKTLKAVSGPQREKGVRYFGVFPRGLVVCAVCQKDLAKELSLLEEQEDAQTTCEDVDMAVY